VQYRAKRRGTRPICVVSVQDAIDKGGELNAKDPSGHTPLMLAAANNPYPEVITAVLNAGADIRAQDGQRQRMQT
jgi:ankyrin repeat protein